MAAFVQAAIDDPDASGSAPLPWIPGTIDGGPDVTSVPMDTPKSLDKMRQDLLSTGQLAINVIPGIGASTLNFIRPPQSVGSPVATFGYQTGSFNSQSATVTDDMDEIINALWYFLGPRGPRAGIPINHWAGSITPTAANAGGDGKGRKINGVFVDEPPQFWPPATISRFMGSRAATGTSRRSASSTTTRTSSPSARRSRRSGTTRPGSARCLVASSGSSPSAASAPTFKVGDFVSMAGGSRLHGGVSGVLEVFEFEVEINVNGIVTITDIIASDNQSGAPSVGG